MNTPFLNLLEGLVSGSTTSKTPVIDAARALVNSPAVALLVSIQNNPIESLILGFAKAVLPPAPTTTTPTVPITMP